MKFLKTYQNDFKGNEHYRITSKKKLLWVQMKINMHFVKR